MTLKSYELYPLLSTKAKQEKAGVALSDLLHSAGRKYVYMEKPRTSFAKTPGEGGLANNTNLVANYLIAWWLKNDIIALQSAVNCAYWLHDTWGERDRAHGHRYAWWPMVGRAANEAAYLDNAAEFDGDFSRWYAYCAADPYVNLKWTGSTLRPFIRIHGAAIQSAHVAATLINAREMLIGGVDPANLRARAMKSLVAWANVHQDGKQRWGFLHDKPRPIWSEPPYIDAKTWTASETQMTWIMPGAIVPDEAASIRLHVSPDEWRILDDFKFRAKQIAVHAIRWGYRADTGGNMKAIGSGKPGSFAPPGEKGAPLVPPMERAESFFEPGYYSGIPIALMAAARNPVERRILIVDWTRTCRALAPGEIPPGLVMAALKVSK